MAATPLENISSRMIIIVANIMVSAFGYPITAGSRVCDAIVFVFVFLFFSFRENSRLNFPMADKVDEAAHHENAARTCVFPNIVSRKERGVCTR